MKKSEKTTEITKALLAAQKEIGVVIKNKIAKGTKFDYNYADFAAVIDMIKGPLNNNNIVFLQTVETNGENSKAAVETTLMHTSGEFFSSFTPICCASPNDSRAFGSALSYAKRYGIGAFLGLAMEDDDGKAASKKPPLAPKKPSKKAEEVLNAIVKKLETSAPEGKVIDGDKVRTWLFNDKGKYPCDMTKVDAIVAWLITKDKVPLFCITKDEYSKKIAKEYEEEIVDQPPKSHDSEEENPLEAKYKCFRCGLTFVEMPKNNQCTGCFGEIRNPT